EMAERDAANSQEQVRDLRAEVARLRDEVQTARSSGENAKVELARIEGQRQAEQARKNAEDEAIKQRSEEAALRQNLSRIGAVRDTARGIVVSLPETIWKSP